MIKKKSAQIVLIQFNPAKPNLYIQLLCFDNTAGARKRPFSFLLFLKLVIFGGLVKHQNVLERFFYSGNITGDGDHLAGFLVVYSP